ncbi:hypothetical protein DFH28DRAFT_1095622 [Melampsora americana]|nr:hypothetical protein DFH28DRAFT_1095622 [Melampsora americana]
MPPTEGKVTCGAACANTKKQPLATKLLAAKRPCQQPSASTNPLLTASYPATQIQQPACSNHQLSAAVIYMGQALLEALDHTIHMLAMVSGVEITKFKRSLGMVGGTHGEIPCHWWLSFALDVNKISMPVQGATDAGGQLTCRDKFNSTTYHALEDNQYMVFTARIFYALGGVPDYLAITIDEDPNVFGGCLTLVPEKLVDMKKVAQDQELNTPAGSDYKEAISSVHEEDSSTTCIIPSTYGN